MKHPDHMGTPAHELTTETVDRLSPKDAELTAVRLLADSARVKEHGTILSWSEFNENPDPLVNRLLAKIIVGQLDAGHFRGRSPDTVAVMSIENSASYLALAMANEIARTFGYSRPPRLVRARKLPRGEQPSPAMSEQKLAVTVQPITAGGESRTLVASFPDDDAPLKRVDTVVVVDDFKATQSTLNGGITLAQNLFGKFTPAEDLYIVPVAALGKPEQIRYEREYAGGARVEPCITALDVRFGPDDGGAFIQANGFGKLPMRRASAADFSA